LPEDIANELAKLQDNVPAFSSEAAEQEIKNSFGRSAQEIFKSFNSVAFASASVAQAHLAELQSGKKWW
jgi:ubiquinone biosynthesis protein